MGFRVRVDDCDIDVVDDGASLLDVLRAAGFTTVKDGCSPQGQCGCCTVWVDGAPRVACVTPARRVAGRSITTLAQLPSRDEWAGRFAAAGASQCGFCTPGIIMRLAAIAELTEASVEQALLAHLCRCTGWRTIVDAAVRLAPEGDRDWDAAARRAAIEGGGPQRVGPEVALGEGGFAEDTAPAGSLVAVPGPDGEWVVGETVAEARQVAGKVQGRRSTIPVSHPLDVPEGEWAVTLRTTWVEPGYLEPDASWCEPGGEPASPLANGGAFGGKADSPAPAAAQRLANEHGRPVRAVLAREDVVRLGPKRPPMAAGVRPDGTGIIRVAATPGIAAAVHAVAPQLAVEEVVVPGPPTSAGVRAAGWAEAAVLLAAAAGSTTVTSPGGATATAAFVDRRLQVRVECGEVLDEVVLRSYCIGAAHMALGWVWSEGLAVDEAGAVHDLTIRSFGILRARDMPPVDVEIVEAAGPAVNGSDAVFAAVAAAAWREDGYPPAWPARQGSYR